MFTGVALLLAVSAAAQVAAAGSLTLQAAIDRALAANPTIAAARLTGAINQAGLALAGERPNPEVTVEFEKETPKQAFGVALPVELGGKRSKRIAVSEATIRAGEAELAATIAQVRNDVRRRVLRRARRRCPARPCLRELRDLSQRVRDTAQARFDAGDAPRLEVLQAGLTLAAAENEAATAEGVSAAARTRLNALLGQPLDTSLQRCRHRSTPVARSPSTPTLNLAQNGSTELAVLDRQIEEQRAKVDARRSAPCARPRPDGHAHARRRAGVHLRMACRASPSRCRCSRPTRRASWSSRPRSTSSWRSVRPQPSGSPAT